MVRIALRPLGVKRIDVRLVEKRSLGESGNQIGIGNEWLAEGNRCISSAEVGEKAREFRRDFPPSGLLGSFSRSVAAASPASALAATCGGLKYLLVFQNIHRPASHLPALHDTVGCCNTR